MLKKVIMLLLPCYFLFVICIDSVAINTSAKSSILIEADSGDVILSNNAYQRLPMASTTKIMTAIVAIENCDCSTEITITEAMVGVEGSSIYLKVGERLTLEQLLYALLLQSANDAAEAIAIGISDSVDNFALLMNEKARELGLNNTNFTNPHGLDDDMHYTTAADLAKITAYALKNELFREIVSTKKYVIKETDCNNERYLTNHNKLLFMYDGTIGVKTGFTKRSGRCLVSAAEKNGVTLIAVTLSAPDDWNDHISMFNYGFEQYESLTLADKGQLSFRLPVICGDSDSVLISNKDSVTLTLKKDHKQLVCRIRIYNGKTLFAPIKKNEHIADAVYYVEDREIAIIPLYTVDDVNAPKVEKRFFDFLKF